MVVLVFVVEFFCCVCSVVVNSLVYFFIVCDLFVERVVINDFLFCWCKFFKFQIWFFVKFFYGMFQYDIEVFFDDSGILFREIESSFDVQGIQFFIDVFVDILDIFYGYQGQQLMLVIDV